MGATHVAVILLVGARRELDRSNLDKLVLAN